jgi:N-methylhydantoinase B/oxoprolinase/acetone carboxylase alpha subunit
VESQIRGHFLPGLVHGALAKVVPERILAQGADCLWNTQITGEKADGEPFTYVFFSGGGMGVRPESDGLSATAIPSGIRGVPAEVIERASPPSSCTSESCARTPRVRAATAAA